MNYLARRDHTQVELTQKLKAKGYELSDIEKLIVEFNQSGLMSDQRFTENYIRWRRRRGYGPQRIAAELQARGVEDEVIKMHIDAGNEEWLLEIEQVWRKHFKGRKAEDYSEKVKQMRFLQYRGFTREQIASLMD